MDEYKNPVTESQQPFSGTLYLLLSCSQMPVCWVYVGQMTDAIWESIVKLCIYSQIKPVFKTPIVPIVWLRQGSPTSGDFPADMKTLQLSLKDGWNKNGAVF